MNETGAGGLACGGVHGGPLGSGPATLAHLTKLSEKEALTLHGMGPVSPTALRAALKAEGLRDQIRVK